MADPEPSARWQRVKDLLDRALELDPARLPAFLEAECGSDDSLRREVLGLVADAERDWSLIDRGPAVLGPIAAAPRTERIGSRIGPYEILSELGRGGMGQVFLARRADDEFQKRVAIKLVPPGPAREIALERFRSERQISATLEHPNIARLLDGGTTAEGEPYFVMEYVEGQPLTVYAEENGLSIERRLRLFREVCEAVHYAHRNLVVHRDIKPSNILVTSEGVPKLLDFGIAKLLDPAGPAAGGETGTLVRMLTPDYASPEQVRGGRVSTSSDVYSLGVVLYELLAGRKPYRIETGDPVELVRLVCEQDPERPSAVSPRLSGDLDAIVLKAMRKEPEHRYASVEAFSADVGRYLDGRPVLARRGTTAYRLGKFVSRNRVGVAAAALLVAALGAGVWATVLEARRARAAEAKAERRFNDVRKLANSFLIEFHDAIENLPGSTPARMLVVQRGIEYLDNLSAEAGDSPDLLRELAAGYQRFGDIQGNSGRGSAMLGDMTGARKSLEKALALRQRLVVTGRATREDRIGLVEAYDVLSGTYTFHGEPKKGIDLARRAVAAAEAIRSPDPDVRYQLAVSRVRLGDALRYDSQNDEALRSFDAAVLEYEALKAQIPEPRRIHSVFAVNYKMSATWSQMGRHAEAAEASRRAIAAAEAELRTEPENGQFQRDVALSAGELGGDLIELGDAASAETSCRRAVELWARLADADSTNPNPRVWLGADTRRLGMALVTEKRIAEGRSQLLESVRILESAIAVAKDEVLGRNELAETYLYTANAYRGVASDAAEERRWLLKAQSTLRALREEGKLASMMNEMAAEVDRRIAASPR